MESLPVGYRFDPTDEELIKYFLEKKVKGQALPHNVVTECDLYADKEPWMIFDKTLKQSFFVFTKLKKKKKSNSRIERTAGCGTWKEQSPKEIKDCNERVIGTMKLFVFEVKKGSHSNGRWIMHEFSLPAPTQTQETKCDDYVLCRIRNKDLDQFKNGCCVGKQQCKPQVCSSVDQIQANEVENLQRKKMRINNSPTNYVDFKFGEDITYACSPPYPIPVPVPAELVQAPVPISPSISVSVQLSEPATLLSDMVDEGANTLFGGLLEGQQPIESPLKQSQSDGLHANDMPPTFSSESVPILESTDLGEFDFGEFDFGAFDFGEFDFGELPPATPLFDSDSQEAHRQHPGACSSINTL